MFQISDKVVCVDDSESTGKKLGQFIFPNGYVKLGQVYDVRGSVPQAFYSGRGRNKIDSVLITGVPAISVRSNTDVGFDPLRFRKLDEIREENRRKKSLTQPVLSD